MSIMIAAWKTMSVSYGECYEMMLMDESVFDELFTGLQDGKSTWHLFTERSDGDLPYGGGCMPGSGTAHQRKQQGTILTDQNGQSVCAFSMAMTSPDWTLVRKVSMENWMQVVRRVRRKVGSSPALYS